MTDGFDVEVYSYNNPFTRLDYIPRRLDLKVMDELNGPGAGTLKVHTNDPKLTETSNLLDYRNIIKVRYHGDCVGAFVIQNHEQVPVDSAEKAGIYWQVTGEGLRTWFHDAVIYPYGGLKLTSWNDRSFNFASEQGDWYNSSDWVPAVRMKQVKDNDASNSHALPPTNWPDDPEAWWIWDRDESSPKPLGSCYFRYEFDITTAGQYSIFLTADDEFDFYIDGAKVATSVGTSTTWHQTTRIDLTMDTGHHIFASKCNNLYYTQGAFLLSFFKFGSSGIPSSAEMIFHTGDAGWLVLPYPSIVPGWSAGEVMNKLLDEASARGVLMANNLARNFTNTHDSSGVAWPTDLDWSFTVGMEYIDALTRMEELGCSFWIDPETYTLNMWVTRGSDKSAQVGDQPPVVFREGQNVLSAKESGQDNIKNSLVLSTADGWVSRTDTGSSVGTYGVVEGQLSTNASSAVTDAIASVVFQLRALPEESAEIEFIPIRGADPLIDFFVGDWVQAPGKDGPATRRRVVSISAAEDPDTGRPTFEAEFDTVFQDQVDILNDKLTAYSNGSSNGVLTANSGTSPTSPGDVRVTVPNSAAQYNIPAPPTTMTITSVGRWNPDGSSYSEADLSWPASTMDSLGFPAIASSYEIWGRRSTETTAQRQRITETASISAILSPYVAGTIWYFSLKARNPQGFQGDFSAEFPVTMVGPSSSLDAPTDPILTSSGGNLFVQWDGKLLVSGTPTNPPVQFSYLYALYSADPIIGFTNGGGTLAGAGTLTIPGLTVGTTYYVKLFAVDRLSGQSPASTVKNHAVS